MYRKIILLFIVTLISGCQQPQSQLQQVISQGQLRVITINSPTTYYQGSDGPTGIEYDLAKGLADQLQVELQLIVAESQRDALSKLEMGLGDLIAAGLHIPPSPQPSLRFTSPYQDITQLLIYRIGENRRPSSLAQLEGLLEVEAKSSHAQRLHELQPEYTELKWTENSELNTDELLELVWNRVLDYTIADSHTFELSRHFYPELRSAFTISDARSLAWAFTDSDDSTLYDYASDYIEALTQSGEISKLLDHYYSHSEEFDYVDIRAFRRHIVTTLPKYRDLFEYAANEFGLDWRLLAAMAYQESHWNPDAVSPTGVRGIMMLTTATADQLGVNERTDPVQSIRGGAMFLSGLLQRFTTELTLPDRLWFAVAAYNIGYYHVTDTQGINRQRNLDPYSWKDLRDSLPLLRIRKWYKKTKYGYARGHEAVKYVENIRTYYEILRREINKEAAPEPPPIKALLHTPASI